MKFTRNNIFLSFGVFFVSGFLMIFVTSGPVQAISNTQNENNLISVDSVLTFGPYDENGDIVLSSALAISVDSKGKIFVADNFVKAIKVFSNDGKYLYSFGEEYGIGGGEYSTLINMGFDIHDNLYVANGGNNLIQIFSNTGEFLYSIDKQGTGDEQYEFPDDVAVDENGRIFVVDGRNDRVQVYSNDEEYLFTISEHKLGFNNLTGLDITKDGKIYITSHGFIFVFSEEGKFLHDFMSWDNIDKSNSNLDIAVNSEGKIFVIEGVNDKFRIFSNSGTHLYSSNGHGTDIGEFYSSTDIDVDDGRIYIADHGTNSIQIFSIASNF